MIPNTTLQLLEAGLVLLELLLTTLMPSGAKWV